MVGSTGNYSGVSSHPPSLNDTSISSASAGKSGLRNTSLQSSNNEREQLQYSQTNQFQGDYSHLDRARHMYPQSSRSMKNLEDKSIRDITSMSDPGVANFDRYHGQYQSSHIQYARPDPRIPHSSFHESPHQPDVPRHHFHEERNKVTKNEYASANFRRKSLSPPLGQRHTDAYPRLQQNYPRNVRNKIRNQPFATVNEVYNDAMYTSSPSQDKQSHDSSSRTLSTSSFSVKDIQKQYWKNNQVSSVRMSPSTQFSSGREQSLSPIRYSQGQGSSSTTNLPRYARSLSPRRRQYQQSSPTEDVSMLQKSNSTISDSSYNNKFHSKFYEAALVAQNRADTNKKSMTENEFRRSQTPTHQYQQKQEFGREIPSSRLNSDFHVNHYPHQNPSRDTRSPIPSQLHSSSSRIHDTESYETVDNQNKRNDSVVNTGTRNVYNSAYRPPFIPPSPSSSTSPAAMINERQGRHPQKHQVSVDRGRARDFSQFHRGDGRNARRIRPPSPNLLDRIRSFDHEYYHGAAYGSSEGQEHDCNTAVGRQDEHLSRKNLSGVNRHDVGSSNNDYKSLGDNLTNRPSTASNKDIRYTHAVAPTNSRFDRKNFGNGNTGRGVIEKNVQVESHRRQNELPQVNAGDIVNDRMTSLVVKLSAVDRENPESALAQIDSILRYESQSALVKPLLSPNSDVETRDRKIAGNRNHHNEQNRIGRQQKATEGEGVASNNEDDDDDDESSDVSSITNPTFQQRAPRKYNSKEIESLYIRENDHYNMHDTTQNNFRQRNVGDLNKLGHNPSTSSFRRPRPSHLQNYSKDVSQNQSTMSRSEWKRQQLEKFPPPTTIRVKDAPTKNQIQFDSSNIREKMLQKNMENARAIENEKATLNQKSPVVVVHGKPTKNLDQIIDSHEGLAEKIRGWDELSNHLSTSRSEHEQEENHKNYQDVGASSNLYPWDAHVNVVRTKDTSMDDAVGIEAEMSTNPNNSDTYIPMAKNEAGSGISNEGKSKRFEKERRNINGQNGPYSSYKKPIGSNSEHGNPNQIPNIATSMSGIAQFDPSGQKPQNHHNRADRNGTSQFTTPLSTNSPHIDDDFELHSSKILPEANERTKQMNFSSKDEGMNELSAGFNNFQIRSDDGVTESRSITRLACKAYGNKDLRSKEKKRGFLRAFMEKKKTKPSSDGHAASATAGSVSGHSNSIESRGVKSASYIYAHDRPKSAEIFSNKNVLPSPPGVLEDTSAARGRMDHRSASQPRSKSSEKFRSSSMAKKFNRVMELYDSNEI